MDIKVKDFAIMQGVSESIVYRHIRQHKEALGDRVIKKSNATWLTDEGQEYIRGLMTQQPIVVGDGAQQDEIDRLRKENDALKDKLIKAHEIMEGIQQQLIETQGAQARLEAAEASRKLLEESRDEYRVQAAQNAQKASEEAQKAQEAVRAAQELRSLLDAAEGREKALKERSWWERLMRKGE